LTEDENKRLENQMVELKNRAEKAELESLKSNQLVTSLRDNNNLLKMQADQLQQEVTELREQRYQQAQTTPDKQDSSLSENSSSELTSDTEILQELYKSELALSPTPEAKQQKNQAKEEKSDSTHLFPDDGRVDQKQKPVKKIRIPSFRIEAEPLLFKNGFNPSSFTIAGLILLALMVIGGIYLYSVMSAPADNSTSGSAQVKLHHNTAQNDPPATKPPVNQTVQNNRATDSSLNSNQLGSVDQQAIPTNGMATTSEQLRLEKELTLRQMAEEEFHRNLLNRTNDQPELSEPQQLFLDDPNHQQESGGEPLPLSLELEAEASSTASTSH
jgi:hypothetical protein